jgi:hypothetical protein
MGNLYRLTSYAIPPPLVLSAAGATKLLVARILASPAHIYRWTICSYWELEW